MPREAHRLWSLLQRASNGRPLPLRVLLFSALATTLWILCTGLWNTSALLGSAYTDIFCDSADTVQPWLAEAQQEYNQLVEGLLSVRCGAE